MKRTHWRDGKEYAQNALGTLSIDEPALRFGATVFTTLRVYGGDLAHPLTQWQAHCDRLRNSICDFNWHPPDWQRVREGTEILKETYPILRITLFPDGQEWISGQNLPLDLSDRQLKGTPAWVAGDSYQRSLPGYKTGNYLACWLALQAAQRQGATEAILTNTQGHWLETSTGNLWGWDKNGWWTPPLSAGILPGTVRSRLIQHLEAQQIPVREAPWTPELTQQLEAIAYSNSVVELVPLCTVLMRETRLEFNPYHPALTDMRSLFDLP